MLGFQFAEKNKILWVGPLSPFLEEAHQILSSGFEIQHETSCARTLQRTLLDSPDVILMDFQSLACQHREVLTQLKEHSEIGRIPIVIFSDKEVEIVVKEQFIHAGAFSFFNTTLGIEALQKELIELIHDLNVEVRSADQMKIAFIAYNRREKIQQVEKMIETHEVLEKKVVIISLEPGDSFFSRLPNLYSHVESGFLKYLQVKPSLLVRFPYMEDLSGLKRDLSSLISNELTEYFWIFYDPQVFLNSQNSQMVNSMAYQLSLFASQNLGEVYYVMSSVRDREEHKNLKELSHILCA